MKNKITRTIGKDGWTEERELVREGELYDVFLVWNSDMGPKPTLVQSLINKFTGRDNRMRSAFNKSGDYIGDPQTAERICDKMGIGPELAKQTNSVCTIGYCAREEKWYGWSHRAIAGFGVGDKIYDEDFADDSAKPQDHGTVEVKERGHARLAATRYAEDVS
jgi:hypothetical protein